MGEPVGQHARLAGAGAGDDDQRALDRLRGPGLVLVERREDAPRRKTRVP